MRDDRTGISHPTTHIVGPAAWASYLVNGDSSGLAPGEQAKADAWLKREGVRIVGLDCSDVTGEEAEPYFTWSARVHAPELDCDGASMLDYRAMELTIDEESSAA